MAKKTNKPAEAQALPKGYVPDLKKVLGNGWSRRSRLGKRDRYVFRGADEPLYKFCASFDGERAAKGLPPVDIFLFGHYHCPVDMPVGPSRLLLLDDWITQSDWLVFDAAAGEVRRFSV